jgi:hypothetical protein
MTTSDPAVKEGFRPVRSVLAGHTHHETASESLYTQTRGLRQPGGPIGILATTVARAKSWSTGVGHGGVFDRAE